MINFTSILADGQASPGGFGGNTLLMVGLMVVVFWVLLIRPQSKARKEQQERINSLKINDKVVTSSGIHGVVTSITERTVKLRVADGISIEFEKLAVAAVVPSEKKEITTAS